MSESEAVFAELEAIDATLRGAPVDPSHAELAELALLLAAGRPEMPEDVGVRLDQKLAALRPKPRRRRSFVFRPVFGLALGGGLAAALAVIVISSGSGGSSGSYAGPAYAASHRLERGVVTLAAPNFGGSGTLAAKAAGHSKASFGTDDTATTSTYFLPALADKQTVNRADSLPTVAGSAAVIPSPESNSARKQVQSAQLQLMSAGNRIDDVSEEVFQVVGANRGIVKNSQVTAGSGNSGFANFSLRIPTGNLQATMTQLSELRYAHVVSRTDATEDVTNQYNSDQQALATALALRTALLKQLANAQSQAQIDSLQAQLADNQATIRADRQSVGGLNDQIAYSNLTVQINAGVVPVITQPSSKGFSLHKALHDAGRVLIWVLGVLLIALAVLIPLSILVGLGWFAGRKMRMRGRERALDADPTA
jgi:uncharacterized protein DUF4349